MTFSTYHDRPEELPGFRLQGTATAARPNRQALAASGVVADLVSGTFEPPVVPARWARTLAGWLASGSSAADRAWTATDAIAARARVPNAPESPWDDAWLGPLHGFREGLDSSSTTPTEPDGWERLAALATWSGRAGVAADWARARGPSWWAMAARSAPDAGAREALRGAFVAHARLAEAWDGGMGAAWGEAVAAAFGSAGDTERASAVVGALAVGPALGSGPPSWPPPSGACRPSSAPRPSRDLKAGGKIDAAMLDPPGGPRRRRRRPRFGRPGPLRDALRRALGRPEVVAADARRRRRRGPPVARGPRGSSPPPWPMRSTPPRPSTATSRPPGPCGRADAEAWLGPHLRRLDGALPRARRLANGCEAAPPSPCGPPLARAFLVVAADPSLADEPFRWGVEMLLLAIPEADRPHDPSWPDRYLARTPSGLDLVKKLFGKELA